MTKPYSGFGFIKVKNSHSLFPLMISPTITSAQNDWLKSLINVIDIEAKNSSKFELKLDLKPEVNELHKIIEIFLNDSSL